MTARTDTPDRDPDLNLVVLCGRLAVDAELRTFDSGAQLVRLLVTTRISEPRCRIDVVPVTLWDPPAELAEDLPTRGTRVWVVGSAQRRYWETPDAGRRSRIEVVAEQINTKPADLAELAEVTR